MTDSDVQTGTWTLVPGYLAEVHDRGRIRSVDRVLASGRRITGKVLATRVSNRGYVLVNVYDDQGVRQTRTLHTLMLLAFAGPCPPGKQALHWDDDPLNNTWPENLRYGTPAENLADRQRNSPAAAPLPPRLCEPHGAPVSRGSSTRCHECVVEMGRNGARLLREGMSRDAAAAELGYSSPDGLFKLAVRYGGYSEPPPPSRSRGVIATVRHWLRRGDSQ